MIYTRVPKEIKEYEEKLIAGLSARQLLYGGISIVISVGIYFLITPYIGQGVASYVVMIFAFPGFAAGFIKKNDMYLDKYFKIIFDFHKRTQVLKYNTERKVSRKEKKNVTKKQEKEYRKQRKQYSSEQAF